MISEVMSWVSEQCRLHSSLRVLTQMETGKNSDTGVMAATPYRGSWYNLRVIPDWIFSVTGPDSIERPDKFYYLECDRSTMPVS